PESGTAGQPEKHNLPAVEKKLGIALVGLGTYSSEELGPALTETAYCRLVGVVSGNEAKRRKWKAQYNLRDENLYSYDNFDDIRSNRDIDIVYVVLPNSMHAEFVIRSARAGKHVICEKPMATSIEDCHRMIDVCKEAGVKLSIGYRLHFDPFNQEVMRLGQNKIFGSINQVIAKHGMDVGDKNQWRLKQTLAGGGPLMDVGIYCVQGVMYAVGELPAAVNARFHTVTDPEKFSEVEEGMDWEMEFTSGMKAICETSYSRPADQLRAEAANGWFELQPAYAYTGLKGKTTDERMTINSINQQAAQMDDFALCIQNQSETRVPGEMGLRDLQILLAIYESARTKRKVDLQLQNFKDLIGI
ncbi:MAG: Gfo/Idh/MocA family oxidoreductase, partial [Cyclobacteriaceae bacterium]